MFSVFSAASFLFSPTFVYLALGLVALVAVAIVFSFKGILERLFSKNGVIAIAIITVVGIVGVGGMHINTLQKKAQELAFEAAKEKFKAEAERQAKELLRDHAERQVKRVEQLEQSKAAVEEQMNKLRDQVRAPDLKKEMDRDPVKGSADFARRSRELNRVLERLSKPKARAGGAGAAKGAEARKASAH